ncbi:MAG: hypothetical protein ACRCTY_09855, partial [Candidatus Adiutrix sp.]
MKKLATIVLGIFFLASTFIACDSSPKEKPPTWAPMVNFENTMPQQLEEVIATLTPTEQELEFLNHGPAVSSFGSNSSGYFTNQDGVSGYFTDYNHGDFNFIWTGATAPLVAPNGTTDNMMNGLGELIVKFMDDELLSQRYRGPTEAGLWQGEGVVLFSDTMGFAAFLYEGNFVYDEMDGAGVLTIYALDYDEDFANNMRYEGFFKNNDFHAQGLLTDLSTNEPIHDGLFLRGVIFQGSQDEWQDVEDLVEINDEDRQLSKVIRLGDLRPEVHINDQPGEGPLTIVLNSSEVSNLTVTHAGEAFEFSEGTFIHD